LAIAFADALTAARLKDSDWQDWLRVADAGEICRNAEKI
jgi:hypothetical protein